METSSYKGMGGKAERVDKTTRQVGTTAVTARVRSSSSVVVVVAVAVVGVFCACTC